MGWKKWVVLVLVAGAAGFAGGQLGKVRHVSPAENEVLPSDNQVALPGINQGAFGEGSLRALHVETQMLAIVDENGDTVGLLSATPGGRGVYMELGDREGRLIRMDASRSRGPSILIEDKGHDTLGDWSERALLGPSPYGWSFSRDGKTLDYPPGLPGRGE